MANAHRDRGVAWDALESLLKTHLLWPSPADPRDEPGEGYDPRRYVKDAVKKLRVTGRPTAEQIRLIRYLVDALIRSLRGEK